MAFRPLPLFCAALLLLGAGCAKPTATASPPPGRTEGATTSEPSETGRYADRTRYAVVLSGSDATVTLVRDGNTVRGRVQNFLGQPDSTIAGRVSGDGWMALQLFDDSNGPPIDVTAAWTPDNTWWGMQQQANGSSTRFSLSPSHVAGTAELDVVHVEKKREPRPGTSCSFSGSFPLVVGGASKADRDRVNGRTILLMTGSSTTQTIEEAANAVADASLAACAARLADTDTPELTGGTNPSLQQFDTRSFSVELDQDSLLSLRFETDAYFGGAHPLHHVEFLNADMDSGKRLTLGDLIAPDKLRTFFQLEKAKLLADHGDVLFDDQKQEFDRFVKTLASPTDEEQVKLYGSFDAFSLTPASLVTFYNEYEIAPYAAGPQQVTLPYASLVDVIKTDGPLGRLLTR